MGSSDDTVIYSPLYTDGIVTFRKGGLRGFYSIVTLPVKEGGVPSETPPILTYGKRGYGAKCNLP